MTGEHERSSRQFQPWCREVAVDENGNEVDPGPEISLEASVALDRERVRRRAAGEPETTHSDDVEVLRVVSQLTSNFKRVDAEEARALLAHFTPQQRARVEQLVAHVFDDDQAPNV